MSKSPQGRKPNKNQGSKTHQEDRRARKIQRNKCKGKRSTTKRRFAANYKSAAEYKFTVEYNSSAEWLRQIKTNWAQILLYKKIGVKTNMKKHDKKKQGTIGSVCSRNHVKERKAKSKENDKRSKERMKK